MRRLKFVVLAAAGIGCSSGAIEDPDARKVLTLSLTAAGNQLQLAGAPLDRSYVGRYPNPDRAKAMNVEILANGTIKPLCEGATCQDSPFFVGLRNEAGGRRLRVWDLYGKQIADQVVEVRGSGPTGPMVPGDVDNPGPGGGGGSSGGEEFPNEGPGGGPCDVATDKMRYCQAINDNLRERNIDYTFDCNALSDDFRFPTVTADEPDRPLWEGRCRELVPEDEVANRQIEDLGIDVPGRADTLTACVDSITLHNWDSSARATLRAAGACTMSPLVLDLDGNGLDLSSIEKGVAFDLLGNGEAVRCAWPQGGDALLALDRNGNGMIDSAAELFGNATGGQRFSDGFGALAELDDNRDGRIDARDAAFSSLRLWSDRNRDARSTEAELTTLGSAKIAALELTAERVVGAASFDANGNSIPLVSRFVREDGRAGLLVDAFFRFAPTEQMVASEIDRATLAKLLGPALQ